MEEKKVIQPIDYRFSEEQSRKNKPSNHQIQLEKKMKKYYISLDTKI